MGRHPLEAGTVFLDEPSTAGRRLQDAVDAQSDKIKIRQFRAGPGPLALGDKGVQGGEEGGVNYNNGTALWYGLGITPGGTDYFSLEESPSIGGATFNNVVITPAADGGSSAVLLGGAVLGLGLLRRRF